jgi:N-acetylmuramoyl-L-alanine amidase
LARVIHGEARGESYLGKLAVGAVVVNRLNSPLFPDTLYEVIYEPWAFTCVQDGQINLEPDEESYRAAMDALNGIDPTNGCLFYYNPKTATSRWMFKRPTDYTETIGNHVFMK